MSFSLSTTHHLYLGFELPISRWLRICGVFKIDAALLHLRSGSLSYGIMSPALTASMSSSSSVKLPLRSLLRIVDGRRVLNSEGRCCPRVDIALAASPVRGRKSFELVRRGRLPERGLEGIGLADDGEFWSVMAADVLPDSSVCLDRNEGQSNGKLVLMRNLDWSRLWKLSRR